MKELLEKAGQNVVDTINGICGFDFEYNPTATNLCYYTFEFENGYTKKQCMQLQQDIENKLRHQAPFNETSYISPMVMKYYRFDGNRFWEGMVKCTIVNIN